LAVLGKAEKAHQGQNALAYLSRLKKIFLNIVARFSISNEEAAAIIFVSTSILQRLVTIHAE
jgi:hypothetical protein